MKIKLTDFECEVTESVLRNALNGWNRGASPQRFEAVRRVVEKLQGEDFQHDTDCPCFGDTVEHSADCKNCECEKRAKF